MDQTDLPGEYDFVLEWSPEPSPTAQANGAPESSPADGPGFFEALKEQLGLKLESTKAPIQVLVIDRVEKPSEN